MWFVVAIDPRDCLTVSVAGSNEKFSMTISFEFMFGVRTVKAKAETASVSISARINFDLLNMFLTSSVRFLSVQTRPGERYSPSRSRNKQGWEAVYSL